MERPATCHVHVIAIESIRGCGEAKLALTINLPPAWDMVVGVREWGNSECREARRGQFGSSSGRGSEKMSEQERSSAEVHGNSRRRAVELVHLRCKVCH